MERITFEHFKDMVLYHRIVEWNNDTLVLDNGVEISIEETEQDCCASAGGTFTNIKLDAAITSVSDIKYKPWSDDDTYGCEAVVKFMHNRNLICQAEANADAGNGGYYYSIASFILTYDGQTFICHFVGSEDE